MPTRALDRVVRHLRRAALPPGEGEGTDGELLGRFVAGRDEAAFAALVRRHGPMVLGVCRRVLGNVQDAEDAFQATFLVLVRKAGGVVPRELVGNWLYGVAYRTALEAKASRARRKAREGQVSARSETRDLLDVTAEREQLAILDRELAGLPERYRAAVVLCDLEGRTHREAARLVGCPEKTLSTRLLRGRKLLARRLAGAGTVLAAVCGVGPARAGVPAPLLHSTTRAALAVAAGQAADTAASARVAGLAEGVLKAMLLNRMKSLSLVIALAGLLVLGAGLLPRPALAERPGASGADPTDPAPEGVAAPDDRGGLVPELQAMPWGLLAVDQRRRTLHVGDASVLTPFDLDGDARAALFLAMACRLQVRGLPVAGDARITIDGKEARLTDLHAGLLLSLKFAADKPVVTSIAATKPPPQPDYVVKEVSAAKGTITVTLPRGGKPRVLTVAKNVLVDVASQGSVTPEHLKPGMHVSLFVELEDGKFLVKHIHATH